MEIHPDPSAAIGARRGGRTAGPPATPGAPAAPKNAAPTNAKQQELDLLDLFVKLSLKLRLRGVGLESSTGLFGRELDLLAMLTEAGPTSVKSLVADLGLPRSTMTAIVDRLQARGLVLRHPNPEDRRSVVLEATPAAEQALHRYRAGMLDLVRHSAKVLDEAERDALVRLVRKLAATF